MGRWAVCGRLWADGGRAEEVTGRGIARTGVLPGVARETGGWRTRVALDDVGAVVLLVLGLGVAQERLQVPLVLLVLVEEPAQAH